MLVGKQIWFFFREEVFEFGVFIVERDVWIWGLRSWELQKNLGKGSIYISPEEGNVVSVIVLSPRLPEGSFNFFFQKSGSCFQICLLLRSETLDPGDSRFKHFVEVEGHHICMCNFGNGGDF